MHYTKEEIQERAQITHQGLQMGDVRATWVVKILSMQTGVPERECVRRIKVCAETGEMPN